MMPATIAHITTNIQRIETGESDAIKNLLAQVRDNVARSDDTLTDEVQLQLTWKWLVEQADKARVADQLPGTVGRTFARQYAGKAQAHRAARTVKSVEVKPKAAEAISVYGDGTLTVENGVIQFTSRERTVKAIEALIKAARNDIERPARESGVLRGALTKLLSAVEG